MCFAGCFDSEMIFQIVTMALGCLGEPGPTSFTAFKLEELIQSQGESMAGMAPAWKNIFQALGAGEKMEPGKLEKMMMEVGVNDVGAYMDPMLKKDLNTETVKEKIQNIAEDKEMLMKIVHGNPMVQQARFDCVSEFTWWKICNQQTFRIFREDWEFIEHSHISRVLSSLF